MTRATRLLQLTATLRRHRTPVSGATLAQTTGVSLRTLYRDIATLQTQGLQIDGEAGIGYLLRPGVTLPSLQLSEDEIEALALGARWVQLQADPELAQAARTALASISSTLPAAVRLTVETSGLLVPPPRNPVPPEPWLPTLRRAIRMEHTLRLDYRDVHSAPSQRTVWPFAMAFFQESRVLVAWCELRQDFRHFRADRVESLSDTRERYPVRRHVLLQRWRAQMQECGSL